MIYIAHRINTIEQLQKVPNRYGVEVDLRDYNDKLILQHDPFLNGQLFDEYLKYFNHNFLILNIKSERIEFTVLDLLKKMCFYSPPLASCFKASFFFCQISFCFLRYHPV